MGSCAAARMSSVRCSCVQIFVPTAGRSFATIFNAMLCSIQRRKNINVHHCFFHWPRVLRKSRKGLEPRLTSWAVPEIASDLVIQEFGLMRCNYLMVAPNTLDSEHEHRASFLHRGPPA